MPHLQRLSLIRAPLPCLLNARVIQPKSWAGVNVGNAGSVPETGHRTWQLSTEEESFLKYLLEVE